MTSVPPRAATLRPTRTDAVAALLLGAAAFALFAVTRQWRIYGDGPSLLRSVTHEPDGSGVWIHVAYLPVARWWNAACDWSTPAEALRFLSVASGAVAVAGTYVLARGFGAGRTCAALAAASFAVTPALWFYATTIEVHALHAAAVVAVALATWFAPWRRPALALLLVAALLPALHLTHQSGATLHLAWIALVRLAWERRTGRAPGRRAVLLAIGPAVAVALVAALVASDALRDAPDFAGTAGLGAFLTGSQVDLTDWRLAGMWGWPIGWLWLALVPAVLASRARRTSGFVALLAALPLLVFFTWLGVPERGAYALGFLPFVVAFIAAGVHERFFAGASARGRTGVVVLGLVLVALQAHLGAARNAEVDDGRWRERSMDRAVFLRDLADGPLVVMSVDRSSQLVETADGTLREIDLVVQLVRALRADLPLPLVRQQIVLLIEGLGRSAGVTVVFDLGHRRHLDLAGELAPLLTAIEEHLAATYVVEERVHGERLYWVLGDRR